MLGCSSEAARVEVLESRTLFSTPGWSDTIDNPNLPMIPGMTWLYRGVKDGEAEKNLTSVQSYTATVMGVTCTVVLDRVYVGGKLAEKTHDYYAQDKFDSVWYFGEDTAEYENGKVVNRDGTWHAGVNGALPGIVMEADPATGDSYQQEFASGVAQDQATVLSLHEKAITSFGTFTNCLKTKEFSSLEPGAAEVKFYQKGIGFVRSQTISGSETEVLRLVQFTP